MLNKTYKNYYILLPGDLNSRKGYVEIRIIVGSSGEPLTCTSGLKIRDFATYNNTKKLSLSINTKIYIHTHGQLVFQKYL